MKINASTLESAPIVDFFAELTDADKYANELIVQFANELRSARKSMNISQAELAELCGVKQPMVCQWESAEENMKMTTLAKIACALGMDLDIHLRPKESVAAEEPQSNLIKAAISYISNGEQGVKLTNARRINKRRSLEVAA